ncbi:MAG: dihydropyrimidine dehydrogenase subunit A [Desulfobacteraceae bacterium 4572_35.1]|nr:MAG: dihydropyrimidine dehydrogenase subunit A [Desulfobacteraceae bacterium 4572_35.1]
MSEIVFSSWGRKIVDNRKGGDTDLASLELKIPTEYLGDSKVGAFMGWDGVVLLDKDVDVVAMAAEYMKRVQEKHCCGKCTPGKKGTRVLQDTLARIVEGHGEEKDLGIIENLSSLLEDCKCTLCMTSVIPVLDTLKHFRDDYMAYISGGRKPKFAGSYHDKLTAPCMDRCPAHIDIPAYIEEIKNYRFDESLAKVRERMPIAAVCGRVCPHPCETACRRALVDEPISIMVLKRVASDHEWMHHKPAPKITQPPTGKKVIVVGAGPAGLSCAYYLALAGHKVKIIEMLSEPGGTVAVGIPDYRMPRHLLQREADNITALGVEIEYGVKLGVDVTLKELKAQYDAVFLGTGCFKSKPMGVEGEDAGYEGFSSGGKNNKITGVEVIKMELGEPDDSGRRRPQPVKGSEYVIPCDMVIPAIGQDPDLSYLDDDDYNVQKTRWNSIKTSGGTMMTDDDGVFAGGDCEYGAMTVVLAVGHGKRAASVMDRYLSEGKSLLNDEEALEDAVNRLGVFNSDEKVPVLGGLHREHQPKISGAERAANYDEIELAMPESQAVVEADRCLRCYRVAMVATDK